MMIIDQNRLTALIRQVKQLRKVVRRSMLDVDDLHVMRSRLDVMIKLVMNMQYDLDRLTALLYDDGSDDDGGASPLAN